MRLGVAATAPLGADVLERLADRHEIAFLLTRPDRPRGRGRRLGAPPAKEVAERLGIQVRQDERLDDSFPFDDVDTILVVAYGALIPAELLEQATWLAALSQRSAAPNSVRGPGFWQVDFMASKDFRFAQTQGIQVRLEFFNITNHLNYENPAASLPAGTIGQPFTDAVAGTFGYMLGPLNRTVGLGTARQTQIAIRYLF